MVAKNENQMNGGSAVIVTGIKEVPITQERPPALDLDNFVKNPGVARVNVAPSKEKPEGICICVFDIRYCVCERVASSGATISCSGHGTHMHRVCTMCSP